MNNVGIRFILEGNNFVDAIVPLDDAKRIIDQWFAGTLQPKLRGPTWGVEVRYIRGIHMAELAPAPVPAWLGKSGVN